MLEIRIDDPEAIQKCLMTEPIVAIAFETHAAGGTRERALEMAVIALCNQKRDLLTQLAELDSIRPRIYQFRDGRKLRWDCPSDLLKIDKLPTE